MSHGRPRLIPGIDVSRGGIATPFKSALAGVALGAAAVLSGVSVPPAVAQEPEAPAAASIVVTTEVLGAVVSDLVSGRAAVRVLMESGADPHAWQPSARDAEAVFGADLVVANGLSLEEGLLDVLSQARAAGIPVFEAADHVTPPAEGTEDAEPDDAGSHAHRAGDPHFWLDPLAMRDAVVALAPVLESAGVAVDDRVAGLVTGLETLDAEVTSILASIPPERRLLVTGHESLGWFADRYGFAVVGTVIPGLTTTGDISARELAGLITTIRETGVTVIFTEVGSPQAVADAVAQESGARLVELRDAQLPEDGSYSGLVRDVALTISRELAE